jgi:hypothetical protein
MAAQFSWINGGMTLIWALSSSTLTNVMLILLLLALIKGILSALSCDDVEIQLYYSNVLRHLLYKVLCVPVTVRHPKSVYGWNLHTCRE